MSEAKEKSDKPEYQKPARTLDEQAELLKSRGLVIADAKRAAAVLGHMNYYRFSGYCLLFESERHKFIENTTFEQVEALYEFDRVLRDLVAEAIEVVEVNFRTAVAYHFAHQYGAYAHTSPACFFEKFSHNDWLEKLRNEAERSNELFVVHFRDYLQFPDLPIWVATEVMSFGALSQMYTGMRRDDQTAIGRRYGLHSEVLRSWMHHLVYVRNLCAHHSRLFGRVFDIKPELPAKVAAWQAPHLLASDRLHCTLLILNTFLTKSPVTRSFAEDWRARMAIHLDKVPAMPNAGDHLGLTEKWKSHPLWR